MKNTCMSSDYIHVPRGFSLIHFSGLVRTLSTLNSCMKDRCGFLFVHYKRHCYTELVSWEHAACLLSGNKKCPLVGGWLNISSVMISIGATASIHYREVVRLWEGPLWEVPLQLPQIPHYHQTSNSRTLTRTEVVRRVGWAIKRNKYNNCIGRESNPDLLLGRQQCWPLHHQCLLVWRVGG